MTCNAMLQPLKIGKLTLANRFVMAPLTRCRADEKHVPTEEMVKYYSDRASFGLIISEATQIREGYSSFAYEGGIFGPEQIEGWKKVTDAVHAKGGIIFCQLHHGGRSTVPCNLAPGLKIVSSSTEGIKNHHCLALMAVDGKSQLYPSHVHALTEAEIAEHVKLFATAAKNAIKAGFDGVELHSANSYLIDQFLRDSCNHRTDRYGGSIENRCRFLFEVLDAVIEAVGRERVGIRLSPLNTYNQMSDSDPEALTRYICQKLNSRGIAFLDIMRGDFFGDRRGADKWARESYDGVIINGMGFELEEAEKEVSSHAADAVCFGVKAIANPDLVERARKGAPLNTADPSTFYTRGDRGYNDYPTLAA